MHPDPLSDGAALAECTRIQAVMAAQRRVQDDWLGVGTPPMAVDIDRDSAFVNGMLAMFRYARGMDVPPVVVQDFRDTLINLMFSGLASGVVALPSFRRMSGKPWALAWRLAELRLAIEGHEAMEVPQLAHLLGITPMELSASLLSRGYDAGGEVPTEFLQEMFKAVQAGPTDIPMMVTVQP